MASLTANRAVINTLSTRIMKFKTIILVAEKDGNISIFYYIECMWNANHILNSYLCL